MEDFSYNLGRVIGVLLILTPFFLIGVGITYWITKNIRKALSNGAIVAVSMILLAIFGASISQAQALPEKTLQEMRSSMNLSCFETQRNDSVNRSFKDSELKNYCQCWSKTIVNRDLTQEDLDTVVKLVRAGATPEKMLSIFLKGRDANKIGNDCGNKIFR